MVLVGVGLKIGFFDEFGWSCVGLICMSWRNLRHSYTVSMLHHPHTYCGAHLHELAESEAQLHCEHAPSSHILECTVVALWVCSVNVCVGEYMYHKLRIIRPSPFLSQSYVGGGIYVLSICPPLIKYHPCELNM